MRSANCGIKRWTQVEIVLHTAPSETKKIPSPLTERGRVGAKRNFLYTCGAAIVGGDLHPILIDNKRLPRYLSVSLLITFVGSADLTCSILL